MLAGSDSNLFSLIVKMHASFVNSCITSVQHACKYCPHESIPARFVNARSFLALRWNRYAFVCYLADVLNYLTFLEFCKTPPFSLAPFQAMLTRHGFMALVGLLDKLQDMLTLENTFHLTHELHLVDDYQLLACHTTLQMIDRGVKQVRPNHLQFQSVTVLNWLRLSQLSDHHFHPDTKKSSLNMSKIMVMWCCVCKHRSWVGIKTDLVGMNISFSPNGMKPCKVSLCLLPVSTGTAGEV